MGSPNCVNYLLLLLCAIIWECSKCGGAVWSKEDEARALRYGQGRISSHATFDLSQDAESQIHQVDGRPQDRIHLDSQFDANSVDNSPQIHQFESRPQGRMHLDSQFDANSVDNSPQIHQFEDRPQENFHIDPLETQFYGNSEKSVSTNRETIHISQLLDEAEMSEGLSEALEETEMSESSVGLGCISCRFLARKAENFAKVKLTHKSQYKGRCLSCGILDPPNPDPRQSIVESRPVSPRFVAATSDLKVRNNPVHSRHGPVSDQSDVSYRQVNPRFVPAQLSDQVETLDLPQYQVTKQQNPKLEDEEKAKTRFEDGIIPSSVSPRLIIGGVTKHEDM